MLSGKREAPKLVRGALYITLCVALLAFTARATAAEPVQWFILADNRTAGWGRDQVSRYFERVNDVDVSFLSADDSGGQTLAIWIASASLPDMITLDRDSYRVAQLVRQGLASDLEALAELYDIDIAGAIGARLVDGNRSLDGKLYLLPGGVCENNDLDVPSLTLPCMLVRDDLLASVGFSNATPEAFLLSLERFRAADPDCVPAGLMPFTDEGCLSLDRYLPEFAGVPVKNALYPWGAIRDDGYIAWLRAFSQAYVDGCLDREVFTLDYDGIAKRLANGGYACFFGDVELYAEALETAANAGRGYTAVPIPEREHSAGYTLDRTLLYGLYATMLSVGADNSETAMRVLYAMACDEGQLLMNFGVEGMMWSRDSSGDVRLYDAASALYSTNTARFRLINGGAFTYDFLARLDVVSPGPDYTCDILDSLRACVAPNAVRDIGYRGAYLAVTESHVRETGLLYADWGGILPELLAAGGSFDAVLEELSLRFEKDGLAQWQDAYTLLCPQEGGAQ